MIRMVMKRAILAALAIVPAALASPAPRDTPVAAAPVHQAQVEARILFAPQVVSGSDGRRHLAYELRITSFQDGDAPLTLERIAVFAGDAAVPLTTIDGAALGGLLARPTAGAERRDGVAIASGQSATLFLWLTLPPGTRPALLRHQLSFRTGAGAIERADDVRAPIVAAPPVVIGPPLRGARWLAVEGPGNRLSHHWGSLVAIDGKLTIPQRFAIDWFGLDAGNHALRRQAAPAATTDADWVGYDSAVIAVADAMVVDARDGVADGTPLAPLAEPDDLTARSLYGNFVVLRIAPGVYAHYAHLRRGTVAVAIGQHVRRGAIIGRLGQTGSAGAPHLHFHLSNRATFEQSEGLPYVIDRFALFGRARIEDSFDRATPVALSPPAASRRIGELPLDGSVLAFP